jgi:hypothetical protein
VPSGDGDEGDGRWVVADLLDVPAYLFHDFLVPGLKLTRFEY